MGKMSCGENVMWGKCHVGKMPCGVQGKERHREIIDIITVGMTGIIDGTLHTTTS